MHDNVITADLNLASSLPEALRGGRDQGGGKELKEELKASELSQVWNQDSSVGREHAKLKKLALGMIKSSAFQYQGPIISQGQLRGQLWRDVGTVKDKVKGVVQQVRGFYAGKGIVPL